MENEQKTLKIGAKTWVAIILLGFIGQLAWNIENSWFNTFVFDMITPDPAPIAWMVGVSAVVSTLTTILVGTWSDRIGKRRPFIWAGYALWGLSTALFPTAVFFKVTGVMVVMVIVLDGVMTALGSTANDAAYNAWIADITHPLNRVKVLRFTAFLPVLAAALTGIIGGVMIDTVGYFAFFYGVGGVVLLSGLISRFLVSDSDDLEPTIHGTYWQQVRRLFAWKTIADNPELFLIFLAILISGIASNISMPYLFIYLENNIGIDKTMIGLVTLIISVISGIIVILLGQFLDRWKRRRIATLTILAGIAGTLIFSTLREVNQFIVLGSLFIAPGMITGIVTSAWLMDLYPKSERGGFQGIRMIFMVALPMVIGPQIGSLVIRLTGIPTISNSESGFIPTPAVFWVQAMFMLLTLIPIFLTKKFERDRKPGNRA